MSKKIILIGNTNNAKNKIGGQVIKTLNVIRLLEHLQKSSNIDISIIRLEDLKLNLFKFLKSLLGIFSLNHTIMFMPSKKGILIILPLLLFSKLFTKNKLIYIVVGGWLTNLARRNFVYRQFLKKVDHILVESIEMTKELEANEISNSSFFANFRFQTNISQNEFNCDSKPFKVLYFGRVTQLKGIDYIFDFADFAINQGLNIEDILVTVAGPMDKDYENDFAFKINNNILVNYHGVVDNSKVSEFMSEYHIVVLPTRYPGEGLPGTIIDSFMCGIPVIVSNWRYLSEYIQHNENGFVFDLNVKTDFYNYIMKLYYDRNLLSKMRENARISANNFSEINAAKIINKLI